LLEFEFDKYLVSGAYHWRQSSKHFFNYTLNVPLVSRYEDLIRLVPINASRVLDVGTGDGYLIYLLINKLKHSIINGIDSESTGLKLAKEQLLTKGITNINLEEQSVYELEYDSNLFDLVTMADVIEHLEHDEFAVKEISRVLKTNGVLLLSTPNRMSSGKWDKRHVHEYDAFELTKLLKGNFRQVEIIATWPMWMINLYRKRGKIRRIFQILCILGFNPFSFKTASPSQQYGQLIARCIK
jgi:2-polyprenyl-3-methyl-5-hydroxy-6-metoxy-1,4-benzoquinol methylase|tara:strand:+ start:949 stop:1671 length:723 start_codon:yes stop_codon:yes gene_type:complete